MEGETGASSVREDTAEAVWLDDVHKPFVHRLVAVIDREGYRLSRPAGVKFCVDIVLHLCQLLDLKLDHSDMRAVIGCDQLGDVRSCELQIT